MASKRRGLPEINAGSMADIAFLLLIFFLVTTTMDVDTGIARKLPPMPDEEQKTPPEIHERNIYTVFINKPGQNPVCLVEKRGMDIKNLRKNAKGFINNNGFDPNLSDSPDEAIISLKCHQNTEYKTYIKVQNELAAAYNELRNEASLNKFGKSYSKLNKEQQKEIKKMYPQKISEAEPSRADS